MEESLSTMTPIRGRLSSRLTADFPKMGTEMTSTFLLTQVKEVSTLMAPLFGATH